MADENHFTDWTQAGLQAMFGEGYVVASDANTFSKTVAHSFTVQKTDKAGIKVSYAKHHQYSSEDNALHLWYVHGRALANGLLHHIKCWGSVDLKAIHTDDEMVAQAKRVLEW